MFKYRFAMLTIIVALIMLTPIHAQEGEVITATVRVRTLNVRDAPNSWSRSTQIGQLHAGDVVTVHQYEQVDGSGLEDLTWVYVTHEPTGLIGWVAGNYMLFSRPDWRDILPHADTWTTLGYEVGTQFSIPIETTVNASGSNLRIRALPSSDSETIGSIPINEHILVYGSAVINGELSVYVYIEYPNGQLKGWVHSYWVLFPIFNFSYWQGVWHGVGWVAALPVVYSRDIEAEYAAYPRATLNSAVPHLRAAPSLDAPILATYHYRQGLAVAVQGRTSHDFDGWAYITVLNSGVSGWMYDPADNSFLLYDDATTRANLPILQPQ